jgi:hypothetical protein
MFNYSPKTRLLQGEGGGVGGVGGGWGELALPKSASIFYRKAWILSVASAANAGAQGRRGGGAQGRREVVYTTQ